MNLSVARIGTSWASLLGMALLSHCGAQTDEGAAVGGETHFLVTCGEECGPGLTCIDGACTRRCEPGFSSCSEFGTSAACVSTPAGGAEAQAQGGTCDVLCTADADCEALGARHSCRAGACRATEPLAGAPLSSTRASLVRAVEPDTCLSGLRWMGGATPSAEMHPGSDCVGCHRDTGARSLILGGTVYAAPSYVVTEPADCFGLEGIEVVVEDAAGREFSMVTNRAGNFYLEGNASDLVMPYAASIRWNLDGQERVASMFFYSSYGGCARCHGNLSAESTPQESFYTPDVVIPNSVIFPPGLYPPD